MKWKRRVVPFISSTGKLGVIDDHEFIRENEKKDKRVDRIVGMIKANHDWKKFIWEVEHLPTNMVLSDLEYDFEVEDVTPVVAEKPKVASKRAKRKLNDPGVESRKRELFCQQAAEHNTGVSGEMKTFIMDLFTSFKEVITGPSDTVGKSAEIPTPSVPLAKDQEKSSQSPDPSSTIGKDEAKSSQIPRPSARKERGSASESVDPHALRRSPETVRK
ncbi:unnamed protein product, partial [Eruca vesicaria subsp. sativa]|nr:unnamed protein product [Eruca vesicaria subsp. sativa]